MEIIVGKNAGFCYGVKRAVEGAEKIIENTEKEVYCIGEIVHNKDVVKSLEKKGINFIEKINDETGIIIIRAHGVAKEIYEKAQICGLEIKDFTCPKVLKIHEIAEEYSKNGYFIVLTGSKEHPENIGTSSFCGENWCIIEGIDEVKDIVKRVKENNNKKILLISQTTYSVVKFKEIEEELKNELPEDVEFIIKNTICATTKIRQEETSKIAKEVDCMIIIGGKNSSNTKKLFEIAKMDCSNCYCVENDKEINKREYAKYNKIGIMAGASTPQKSIDDIINKLKS